MILVPLFDLKACRFEGLVDLKDLAECAASAVATFSDASVALNEALAASGLEV